MVYCPTELMIGDFFSKPIQGELFRRMRAVILGQMTIDEFMSLYDPSSKERVGIDEKMSDTKLANDEVSLVNEQSRNKRSREEERSRAG